MTGSNKTVRALFAALVTILLAVLMHLGAGGAVSLLGAGIVFVLVLWTAMILAGRRLGYLPLVSLLGLGQVLMHYSMSWFGPPPAVVHIASGSGAAHAGHIVPASGTVDLSRAASMAASHAGAADAGMVLAHLAAILVTAVALKRGEDIVLSILQLALGPISSALRALAEAAGILAQHRLRALGGQLCEPSLLTSAVIGANYRRGPPVLV